jgi:hypothetical protein
VAKPNLQIGIGVDALPEGIRNSRILSGNHLGQLANVHEIPVIHPSFDDEKLRHIIQYFSGDPSEMEKELHRHAATLLDAGKTEDALQVLLVSEQA